MASIGILIFIVHVGISGLINMKCISIILFVIMSLSTASWCVLYLGAEAGVMLRAFDH